MTREMLWQFREGGDHLGYKNQGRLHKDVPSKAESRKAGRSQIRQNRNFQQVEECEQRHGGCEGLPQQSSGQGFTFQCRVCGFEPWFGAWVTGEWKCHWETWKSNARARCLTDTFSLSPHNPRAMIAMSSVLSFPYSCPCSLFCLSHVGFLAVSRTC